MPDPQESQSHQPREVTDEEAREIGRVEELSYELKISEIMTRDVKATTPGTRISDLLEILRVRHMSGLPVLENNELIGIISIEDIVHAMAQNDLSAPVSKHMSTRIYTVKEFEPVVRAIEKFSQYRVGRLPVLNEYGKLVGIITKGDITRGILTALQKDYKVEEVRRYRASHLFEDITSDRTSLIMRYDIKAGDYQHGGQASSNIKRALLRLGASPQLARQCGIAIYEAEMNLIIHTTEGGIIRVQIDPYRILMQVTDTGPGIPDIKLALQAGWSTASQEVRNMGFGAGMGLTNMRRCVDRLDLESTVGKGTKLVMEILLSPDERFKEDKEPETLSTI
ncbi:MAG TPA: CBS domain-containing protein [Anaerolineales bacterium]|nr:CBS domain-containing protein [Anaerolineales bacterium]